VDVPRGRRSKADADFIALWHLYSW
jgi:hypothetical protein